MKLFSPDILYINILYILEMDNEIFPPDILYINILYI